MRDGVLVTDSDEVVVRMTVVVEVGVGLALALEDSVADSIADDGQEMAFPWTLSSTSPSWCGMLSRWCRGLSLDCCCDDGDVKR